MTNFVVQNTSGGMIMDANQFWLAFLDTGAPEMYLLYTKAKRMEGICVSVDQGPCTEGYKLQ